MPRHDAFRRRFLRHAALLAPIGRAGVPFALNLAAMGAAAQSANDYRALVCVFLFGGNDQGNTVLATDADSWNAYRALRANPPDPIALPAIGEAGGVLPVTPVTAQSGRSFGLHPELAELKSLFDGGRAAVIANVGPLIAPTTKAQYRAASVPLPDNLFSHNDQQSTWQAYAPEGARFGWGGRLGDLLASMNATQTFSCMSAAGNAVWLAGRETIQYQVGRNGATAIGGVSGSLFGSSAAADAFRAIVTAERSNLLERSHAGVVRRAIDAQASLNAAMLDAASLEPVPNLPGTTQQNPLAVQLNTIARIIGGRAALGARRQVFFVSMGGFDTHDNQRTGHAALMARLGQALAYFDRVVSSAAIGAGGEVTTFTASDFGRTGTSNGDGTDHGWGSHHFVVGGAVRGGDIYGRYPTIGKDTDDDVGNGRLLPSTSVDQYGATLARWYGVPESLLDDVFPNLANFGAARNLGFMI